MGPFSYADAYEVLCLQAADDGRGELLFGDSLQWARKALRPFMIGSKFPSVYFEFPLKGDPFLDVTVLYGPLDSGMHVESDAAAGTDELFDWYAGGIGELNGVSFGFELDTKAQVPTAAAIHFQPRAHTELVEPFCEAAGEPDKAPIYLSAADRMPDGWKLSFFGMFRGRPGSPLRVCGYLDPTETQLCANDPNRLVDVFDAVGFTSYDDAMLSQVRALMSAVPKGIDFQFDVYPDGTLGDTFAIDLQFGIEQPEAVQDSFAQGPAAQIFRLLEGWGVADRRWKLAGDTAFARAIPFDSGDEIKPFSFVLMPQWVKARWKCGVLQPSKIYLLGKAGIVE